MPSSSFLFPSRECSKRSFVATVKQTHNKASKVLLSSKREKNAGKRKKQKEKTKKKKKKKKKKMQKEKKNPADAGKVPIATGASTALSVPSLQPAVKLHQICVCFIICLVPCNKCSGCWRALASKKASAFWLSHLFPAATAFPYAPLTLCTRCTDQSREKPVKTVLAKPWHTRAS